MKQQKGEGRVELFCGDTTNPSDYNIETMSGGGPNRDSALGFLSSRCFLTFNNFAP